MCYHFKIKFFVALICLIIALFKKIFMDEKVNKKCVQLSFLRSEPRLCEHCVSERRKLPLCQRNQQR